ncbi:hypothetical protein TRICI_003824 [Trichomonascus ciferrii]|uniref:Intron-binding protein aquarius N-terminal domain-containing protein n=1 Tax=Trichomonascus ciferrii TaxID=44093 RepID=A0A642V2P4_9ASCO|nr:hypothetical protein TRICI_003824 [Trichomonascus ciferrii]
MVLDFLCEDGEKFGMFFKRVLMLALDLIDSKSRSQLFSFLSNCFGSLHVAGLRKQVAPLISISIWSNLSDWRLNQVLDQNVLLKKAWKSANRKYDNADDDKKGEIEFHRSWLFKVTLKFINSCLKGVEDDVLFVEAFIEFLTRLLSQVPTRRYTNTLLHDLNVPAVASLARFDIAPFVELLNYYAYFPIDDYTGEALTEKDAWKRHCRTLWDLQELAYSERYKDKLSLLSLANFDSIQNRVDLEEHLSQLSTEELFELAGEVGIRTNYDGAVNMKRKFVVECFIQKYSKKKNPKTLIDDLDFLPREKDLFSPVCDRLLRHQGNLSPLPIHRLDQQYLTLEDFWTRMLFVERAEYFCRARRFIERNVRELKPQTITIQRRQKHNYDEDDRDIFDEDAGNEQIKDVKLGGSSEYALKVLNNPAVLEVGAPLVGETKPSFVRVEVDVDLGKYSKRVARQWENLEPGQLVYLMNLESPIPSASNTWERLGLKALRAAEVVAVLDGNSVPLHRGKKDEDEDSDDDENDGQRRRYKKLRRKIHVNIDAVQYGLEHENVLINHLNVISKPVEKDFSKRRLSWMRSKFSSGRLPEFITDAFLGFGAPDELGPCEKVDFMDTFKSVQQAKKAMGEGVNVETASDPPYIVEKKQLLSYHFPNTGPYDENCIKPTPHKFTDEQLEAIVKLVNPGFNLIDGVQGLEQATVCAQVLNIIYNSFPHERTLVVAKTSTAITELMQLLQKLNVDDKRVVRLDLLPNGPYYSETRRKLLEQVEKLSSSIGISGAHGDSCETAEHFYSVYIGPMMEKFQRDTEAGEEVEKSFPFTNYFNDVNTVFDENQSEEEKLQVANGYMYHVRKLFESVEFLRPFELVHTPRAQRKYLTESAGRIVFTTTKDDINATFDNVVFLQSNVQSDVEGVGATPTPHQLRRVIVVGDHQQQPVFSDDEMMQRSSLLERFIRQSPITRLPQRPTDHRVRSGLIEMVEPQEPSDRRVQQNAGFLYPLQLINVEEDEESENYLRGEYENIGEAEYLVSLYRYMRLLGYPREKIDLVATTKGQKKRIDQIAKQKCKEGFFGAPTVFTAAEYCGERCNDYVLVSLVRTKIVAAAAVSRQITALVSRCVKGMYIVGKKALFSEYSRLGHRPSSEKDDLLVVTGELYNKTRRKTSESPNATKMVGLEHLSAYVEEMTQQRLAYESRSGLR